MNEMKKIALTIAALAMTSGIAMAENPFTGTPADLYANDTTPVAANFTLKSTQPVTYTDGSAHGFSDHSPSSTRR
uniref:Superoxide dismutase n=1 Tax=Parastrongyloides trichosuri TaxID=131310 RepID=A0A0N4ZWM6_PARTI